MLRRAAFVIPERLPLLAKASEWRHLRHEVPKALRTPRTSVQQALITFLSYISCIDSRTVLQFGSFVMRLPPEVSSRHSRCGRMLKTCHRHVFLTHRPQGEGFFALTLRGRFPVSSAVSGRDTAIDVSVRSQCDAPPWQWVAHWGMVWYNGEKTFFRAVTVC